MKNYTVIFIGIFLLLGCVSGPKELQLASNQQLVSFASVTDKSVGKVVRWGGVVTSLSEQDGVANVIVTQYPLLRTGQPTYKFGSGGTFTARFNNSLIIDELDQGSVLTIVGKIEDIKNPYPDLKTTQLAIVQTDDFYVWEGFSRASNPIVEIDHPAFIKRGKWGWELKSQKDKDRERQEKEIEWQNRNRIGGVGSH